MGGACAGMELALLQGMPLPAAMQGGLAQHAVNVADLQLLCAHGNSLTLRRDPAFPPRVQVGSHPRLHHLSPTHNVSVHPLQ